MTTFNFSVQNGFYLDKVWIQCEKENCLKWRLLSHDEAALVDSRKPWYCCMNTDPGYNICSVPEENFPAESQFHQSGLKLVYSQLPLGSLVLIKICGWPSWPGILCPDPFTGEHVTYDGDGNVESYHVEFLGNPRTRLWSPVKHIKSYQSIALKLKGKMQTQKRSSGARSSSAAGSIKRKRTTSRSYQVADVEDILTNENLASQTENLLKDLEEVLKQVTGPAVSACTSQKAARKSNDAAKSNKRKKCSTVITGEKRSEVCTQDAEDCVIIDGIAFKTGDCIEEITDQFKEIDALMTELEKSL